MAISNWLAPSIIALFGPRICLFAGAIPYVYVNVHNKFIYYNLKNLNKIKIKFYRLYLASFLYPLTWLLYLMAGLVGFGAAGKIFQN